MTQPGMISHGMPPMADDLARRVRDLERAMEVVRGRSIQAVNTAQAAASEANDAISLIRGYNFTASTSTDLGATARKFVDQTITVPAGMTQLGFFAAGAINAANNSGALDELALYAVVAGQQTYSAAVSAPAGHLVQATTAHAGRVGGLSPGQTVAVQLWAGTGGADWGNTAVIGGDLNLLVVWQP